MPAPFYYQSSIHVYPFNLRSTSQEFLCCPSSSAKPPQGLLTEQAILDFPFMFKACDQTKVDSTSDLHFQGILRVNGASLLKTVIVITPLWDLLGTQTLRNLINTTLVLWFYFNKAPQSKACSLILCWRKPSVSTIYKAQVWRFHVSNSGCDP